MWDAVISLNFHNYFLIEKGDVACRGAPMHVQPVRWHMAS
jgi:hypothetical protein